ncbi:MAG: caspase family protein, partial [Rhizobiaceae bacterium]
ENPNITYRQLGHAVLQQYQADSRQRPTPLFEGELDARVFGTEAGEALQQWPVQVGAGGATVPAGMLHRLSPGTRLAVLPSPLSTLEEAVGYLEVKSAKNLTSTVAPVAFDGKPAVTLSDLPPNAYARLAEVAVDFKLRVARPAETEGLAGQVALVNSTLDALASADGRTFNVELVPPGAEADIRLAVLPQGAGGVAATASPQQPPALFFLPPSGELETRNGQKPPRVVMDPAEVDRFKTGTADNLTKIFRATSLSRLAAASDYQPEQVSVQFLIKREGKDAMEPLDAASVPMVSPGDEVHILAENKSPKLVDINILYVGSDYSITHIDSQRLVSGAKIEEGLLAFTDESFGMERMIAVLTEAPAMSEVEDLSFLAQAGVPATRSASMTRGGGGFSDMLTAIGMAQGTRAVMKLGDKGDAAAKGAVMIFPMETMPRP